MWIKRHREEFSLCDWQFLLEFDTTVFYTEGKLQHLFIHLGFRGFDFFRELSTLGGWVE